MCLGRNVCTLKLFGPSYWKTNIIQNSGKYKIAFLFCFTKPIRVTPSGHLLHRLSSTEVKLRQSKPVVYDMPFSW